MAVAMARKTNERPGTRAVLRHCRMSSYKAREVLDLVRGMDYSRAVEILEHTDRGAAPVVAKLLRSAAANAEHNEGLDPEELYVSTAYADEGATLKRWRPRARGRATRIRKRSCHITVILSPMPADKVARRRARAAAEAADRRARRVAGTRRRREEQAAPAERAATNEAPADEVVLVPEEASVAAAPATEATGAAGELGGEETAGAATDGEPETAAGDEGES
ncbi:MAG: 50S ribosomal protein L22 [Actinomycetota bacterium]|nr:50S ribosomal protein L22 [Actinomycetota bacterium]